MKKVLITGASGLIGSHILKRMTLRDDVEVRAVVHEKPLAMSGVETFSGDLQDRDFCAQVVEGMDWVFHCAAVCVGVRQQVNNPTSILTPNVVMHSQMLEAANRAGVSKFVWPSSTSGYPFVGNRAVKEEDFLKGEPHEKYYTYGWMTRFIESLCRFYSEGLQDNMLCICPRASSVVGPHDSFDSERCHVFSALLKKAIRREDPFLIWGTGREARDFIFVDDLVDAIMTCVEKLDVFMPVNIAYGKSYTITELAEIIIKVEGYNPSIEYQPAGPTSIPERHLDITKAQTLLGWSPKVTLEQAIRRTAEWYRSHLAEINRTRC